MPVPPPCRPDPEEFVIENASCVGPCYGSACTCCKHATLGLPKHRRNELQAFAHVSQLHWKGWVGQRCWDGSPWRMLRTRSFSSPCSHHLTYPWDSKITLKLLPLLCRASHAYMWLHAFQAAALAVQAADRGEVEGECSWRTLNNRASRHPRSSICMLTHAA